MSLQSHEFFESGAVRTHDMEVPVLKMEEATEVQCQGSIIYGDDDERLGDFRLGRDSVVHGGPTRRLASNVGGEWARCTDNLVSLCKQLFVDCAQPARVAEKSHGRCVSAASVETTLRRERVARALTASLVFDGSLHVYIIDFSMHGVCTYALLISAVKACREQLYVVEEVRLTSR